MKKFAILGLTLIFLLALVACSANNSAEDNKTTQNEVNATPADNEADQMEDMDVDEPAEEPVADIKPAVEPKAEAEVVEEPKVEAEPAVVKPKEQPPAVESKEPAVVEPTPAVAAPKTHKVNIENFAFSPITLEISVGDIVEFTNLDTVKHSAVEDNGVFDTGLLGKDESNQITFEEAGEFAYHCGPHPGMKANIIVK
jgi:plastocyanin